MPSLDAKPLNSTLSLPLCHHSLLSPAPSLQFNSLSPVKSKLLLLILTEFLLSMVRPATVWFVYFFLLFVKCCFCVSLVSKSTVVAAYKFFCVVQKRDWKRCMDSAYVLRFRPVRVRKIGILKHSPDCMLVQQDSSNWPRDSVMDFHFSFFFLCHFIDLFES